MRIALVYFFFSSVLGFSKDNLEVSLLTCSTGDDIHAAFGHTAIRIVDLDTKKDMVYDYGIFDWNTDFFVWKFISGDLQYRLSGKSYSTFYSTYEREERGIIENELILSKEAKIELQAALLENCKKDNRYYDYEFFRANCSTMARDKILKFQGPPVDLQNPNLTFRGGLHQNLENHQWLKLGIDLILGKNADTPLTFGESMFLPHLLQENLQSYSSDIEGHSLLSSDERQLLEGNQNTSAQSFISKPLFVLSLILVILAVCHFRLKKASRYLNYSILTFYGLIGLLLVVLWFGSRHDSFSSNFNLIWANPLLLIYPFLKIGKVKKYMAMILLVISSAFVITASINLLSQEISAEICILATISSGILLSDWMRFKLPNS